MPDKMSGAPGFLSGIFFGGKSVMKRFDFTEGGYFFPLVKFTIPILAAIFLQAMYGAVDLMVVGFLGDASSVSAVGTGSQIMQTITGIITGLTMGTTIMLGQMIGAKQTKEADGKHIKVWHPDIIYVIGIGIYGSKYWSA
jgi:hypothetical protein